MVLAVLFSSQLVGAWLGRALVFGRAPGAGLVPAGKAWAGWLLPAFLGAGAALWGHFGGAAPREVVELGVGTQLVASVLALYVLRAEARRLLAQRVAHVSLLLVAEPGRSAAALEVRGGLGVLRAGAEDLTPALVARAGQALGAPAVAFDAELACAVVRRLRFMAHGDVRGWREPGEGRILLGVVPAGPGPRRGLAFQVSFSGGAEGTLVRLSAAPADLPVEG